MAKKRTLQPFYGKQNQWLDQAAHRATQAGNLQQGSMLYEKSKELLEKRSKAKRI